MLTDPHKELLSNYVFQVDIPDIGTIGYFIGCSGLEIEVEVLTYAEGGNNEVIHQLPGRIRFPNLVLTRGMTKEKQLAEWFTKTRTKADRKEVTITLYVSGASINRKWAFKEAFPVKWIGPAIDTAANDVATEVLHIAHSGMTEAS